MQSLSMEIAVPEIVRGKFVTEETFLNARTDTYVILAEILNRAPSTELLCQIQRVVLNPDMPGRLIDAWIFLRNAARKYPEKAVAEEFQSVFVGLGDGEVVPYASWYLDGLVKPSPLTRLRLDLAKLGIGRRKQVHEAEDHAGLLCETMALLGRQRQIPVHAYARFFDGHISTWMFDFFIDLQKAPSAAFYRSVGRLGICLLELEQVYLCKHRAAYAN
ncbi:MAG: molecular chaperone TorD [Desulfobacteraceae bacterium]|nr:MAG: molecular chaperone TorD [Desulfobacteraceae bacterium]